jgi:hypothetical protein
MAATSGGVGPKEDSIYLARVNDYQFLKRVRFEGRKYSVLNLWCNFMDMKTDEWIAQEMKCRAFGKEADYLGRNLRQGDFLSILNIVFPSESSSVWGINGGTVLLRRDPHEIARKLLKICQEAKEEVTP